MRSLSFVLWATLGSVFLVASGPFVQAAGPQTPFQVLVFSKTLGYRHASITNGIAAIRELGARNGFAVDATEDSDAFTRLGLSRYAVVIFLSATGKVLDSDQEGALKDYVMGGGGFVAIHGAVFGPQACEDQWSWYGEMFCCAFTNHSQVVPAIVNLEDTAHASNEGLPAQWPRSDEWYNFTGTPRDCARVLATVDETTYTGGKMGQDHPIAWCRRVGQGRMWYTAMGHTEASFAEPLFQQHLLGGIRVATGRAPADFAPNARTAIRYAWKREVGSLALIQNESAVWQLNYATNTTKPYFHPVAVPGGPVLTWDRPPDHPWHHALWFSWKFINGLNYWETEAQTKEVKGLTQWDEPMIQAAPGFSARIVLNLRYRPPNEPPVVTERRVIEVSAPDQDGNYDQDWTMTFTASDKDVLLDRTPLPGEAGGQLWGGYAGLSVRFANSMADAQALSTHGPVALVAGRYRGKALAMDYNGIFGGRQAGIAILDFPGNLNSPSPWYVIGDNTMRYFSPAVIQIQPYHLKAGQSFTLRYRVVVHPGRWTKEQLGKASERFRTHQP